MDNSSLLDKTLNCKLVLLGDTAVGKSCITVRFVKDLFYDFQEPTIGASFSTANVEVDNKKVKFEIWDTAGQERYRSLAPMYYRGAKFAVVVYDITSKTSFTGAQSWVDEIKKNCGEKCIIILVGNKLDLENKRKVDAEEVNDYAESKNISHIEVSAKTGDNVVNIFHNLVKKLSDDNLEPESEPINKINLNKKLRYKFSCC